MLLYINEIWDDISRMLLYIDEIWDVISWMLLYMAKTDVIALTQNE
jgi:hypothetical protein